MPIIIYNKMRKIKICNVLIVFFLFFFQSIAAFTLDKEIVAGRDDNWTSLYKLNGISIVKGKFGLYDVVLKDAEYTRDNSTDLLLHFNSKDDGDETGHYIFSIKKGAVSKNTFILGGGSMGLPNLQEGEDVLGLKYKYTINPRLGVSHPITDRDLLYFQFGRFTQEKKFAIYLPYIQRKNIIKC